LASAVASAMLVVTVNNMGQSVRVEHHDGPLELERRERPGKRRIVIHDPFVSRDHLPITEGDPGRVFVECLSETKPVALGQGESLQPGQSRELPLPTWLHIGYTRIELGCGTTGTGGPLRGRLEAPTAHVVRRADVCQAARLCRRLHVHQGYLREPGTTTPSC